jgi:hypothetical protein
MDLPNNRYGMLSWMSPKTGVVRRCRACHTGFKTIKGAQRHVCRYEKAWRASSGHILPETVKNVGSRRSTKRKSRSIFKRVLSLIRLGW